MFGCPIKYSSLCNIHLWIGSFFFFFLFFVRAGVKQNGSFMLLLHSYLLYVPLPFGCDDFLANALVA